MTKYFCLLLTILSLLASCTPEPVLTDVESFISDKGNISVYFCPNDNCELQMLNFFNSAAKSIHCAFYDFNLNDIYNVLLQKSLDIKILLDQDSHFTLNLLNTRIDNTSGLMHNKFCIIDDKEVMTGSMNPTVRDTTKNNNNLFFINSKAIASIYQQEFFELWDKQKNQETENNNFVLDNVPVSVYFCPEDHCADKVIKELRKAKHSVYFMTYSFTHTGITSAALSAMNRSVHVAGVFEKSQAGEYSSYEVLLYQGADVILDKNSFNLHHKVFIIDNETVISGSFNPTANGDKYNDENMIIIRDKNIARLFVEEFEKVKNGK